jgi:hypothetical protein
VEDYNQWVIIFGKIFRYSPKYHKDKEIYTLSQAVKILKDLGYIKGWVKKKKSKNRRMV